MSQVEGDMNASLLFLVIKPTEKSSDILAQSSNGQNSWSTERICRVKRQEEKEEPRQAHNEKNHCSMKSLYVLFLTEVL